MDQKILSEVGDYLLEHSEEIIGEWLRAVERNVDISSSDELKYKELVDHLPEVFQDLAKLLKSPKSRETRNEVSRAARIHGIHRFRQGYRLEEVIREASIIRRVLFRDWLEAYARKVPEFKGETRKVAEDIIHQVVDDIVTDSAEQFVAEREKTTNELNIALADGLAEVRHQKAEADAANEAKDRFLAMLSHELRTPLDPILMWSNAILEDQKTPPELKEGARMIRRNVELEARMIDDLLDVARISGGKLQLNLQVSDAASLFRQALEMVQAEAVRRRLDIRVDLTATNHRVIVDRTRMQQVFWNVLKNAKKFTPDGGTISIRSFNENEAKVVFEITDTGRGIEPDLLPKIFDTFQQGVSPAGGLGLGLAISKAIIEAHGGRIHASSKGIGTGATFTIELKTAPNESNTLSP
jgi:signal transduction histidine kinase